MRRKYLVNVMRIGQWRLSCVFITSMLDVRKFMVRRLVVDCGLSSRCDVSLLWDAGKQMKFSVFACVSAGYMIETLVRAKWSFVDLALVVLILLGYCFVAELVWIVVRTICFCALGTDAIEQIMQICVKHCLSSLSARMNLNLLWIEIEDETILAWSRTTILWVLTSMNLHQRLVLPSQSPVLRPRLDRELHLLSNWSDVRVSEFVRHLGHLLLASHILGITMVVGTRAGQDFSLL